MELHPYALARRALQMAEDRLSDEVDGVADEVRLFSLVAAVVDVLHGGGAAAAVARLASCEEVLAALSHHGHADYAAVRFVLRGPGGLALENAQRPFGSAAARFPSCLYCGGLTDDFTCDACFDTGHPPQSPREPLHRGRVRAALRPPVPILSTRVWHELLSAVSARAPELNALLLRAVPLRLHRTGLFCVSVPSDELAVALQRHSRAVELLLADTDVLAIGYHPVVAFDPATGEHGLLLDCRAFHEP